MREIPKEIIEKAGMGDMGAFEEIYKVFSPAVYTIALGITRNRQDAEEATQDVFVKIFRTLNSFKFRSSFGTWIYRIASNAAINIYNARARHRRRASGIDGLESIPDSKSENARDAIQRESAAIEVSALLKVLNPEQRSCIVLRELQGLGYSEIAETLRVPVNTVRSRLKRAREALVAHCRKGGLSHGL